MIALGAHSKSSEFIQTCRFFKPTVSISILAARKMLVSQIPLLACIHYEANFMPKEAQSAVFKEARYTEMSYYTNKFANIWSTITKL